MKTKVISILLCLTVVFGMFLCLPISASTSAIPVSSIEGTTVSTGETYSISTKDELVKFASICTEANNWCAGVTFIITDDIDLNEGWTASAEAPTGDGALTWTPIYQFSGVLDGQGHTLSGFYAPEATAYATSTTATEASSGIFAAVGGTGATVKNLNIANSYFASTLNVGSVAGTIPGNTNNENLAIENVSSSATLYTTGGMAGGIVGVTNSSSWNGNKRVRIEGCSFGGSITSASVTNKNHIGGIIGKTYKPVFVYDCVNTSNITISDNTTDFYLGGIVAWANSTLVLDGCINGGNIKFARTESNKSAEIGNGNMGGLAAFTAAEVDIDRCASFGNVTLVKSPSVTANERSNLGGFIGYANNFIKVNITDCLSAGNVTGTKTHCGGFIGNYRIGTLNFERCIFTGDVSNNATNWRGVFIGFMGNAGDSSAATFKDCVYNNAVNPIGCSGTPTSVSMTVSMTGSESVTAGDCNQAGYTEKFETAGAGKSLSAILATDAKDGLLSAYDWTESENGWVTEQIEEEGDYIPMPRAVATLLSTVELPEPDTETVMPDSGNTDGGTTGGNTDGGTTGGNTDGGTTGGNTDSGNTDGGTTGGAVDKLPDVFDPSLIIPGGNKNEDDEPQTTPVDPSESESESESEDLTGGDEEPSADWGLVATIVGISVGGVLLIAAVAELVVIIVLGRKLITLRKKTEQNEENTEDKAD